MASSKKRKRSLTREDDEDEESHPRVEIDLNKEPELDEEAHPKREIDLNKEPELDEEYDCDRADLNKEAETDNDAKQEEEAVGEAEKKKMESGDKDANPRNRNRETTMRRLTPEEEEEGDKRAALALAMLVVSDMESLSNTTQARNQPNRTKKRAKESKDEDDSEQTLALLSRWESPLKPPGKIVNRRLIEQCSRPIRKQLTVSDVRGDGDQSRLALSKSQVRKKFLQILEESEIPSGKGGGTSVSVYGPDGKVHEMKMFPDEKKSPDLMTGWRKFVRDYELKEFCDFITIWIFKHTRTQQICLAIDTKRLSLKKQVSNRISRAAFD